MPTIENITETNRLIAEFMGVEIVKRNNESAVYMFENAAFPEYFRCTQYNTYDKDWNMLMDVIDKIEDIRHIGAQAYINISAFEVTGYCSGILGRNLPVFSYTVNGEWLTGKGKIKAVYDTVLSFINWYNQNKQP